LDPTDLTTRALEILHPSSKAGSTATTTTIATPLQRTISVVGRRGHVQGAFTIKELRELTKLPHADFVVRSDEIDMGKSSAASRKELEGNRPRTRIDTLLTDAACHLPQQVKKDRQIQLRFLLNPVRFEPDPENPSKLGSVVCERTRLIGEPGSQGAVGTGEEEAIPAQLALVSIGYKGVAIEGTEPWFDESRGILKNTHGLVESPVGTLGAVYTAGWLKRGPSGIIGTNIPDAKDTVATILHDMAGLTPKSNSSPPLRDLLEARGVQYVDWESYRRIDAAETNSERKRHPGQPREKITRLEELLNVARGDSD
jgi:adrenodoxin-NADP+ reductase